MVLTIIVASGKVDTVIAAILKPRVSSPSDTGVIQDVTGPLCLVKQQGSMHVLVVINRDVPFHIVGV